MSAGILVWGYTLLLPSISDAGILGARIVAEGRSASRCCGRRRCSGSTCRRWCTASFSACSLNIALYVGCSLWPRGRRAIERMQADRVRALDARAASRRASGCGAPSVTVEELIATVARYLGEERTRESFASFAASRAPHARAASRGRLPARCNMASICWRRRSARPPRGSCCRSCCASATSRPRRRSSCSTTPTPRSTTIAKSCRPRSTTCARASPCSTRSWRWSAGTASSASSSTCRTGSPASASRSTKSCATSPSSGALRRIAIGRIRARPQRVRKYRRKPSRSWSVSPIATLVIEVRANRMPGGGLATTFTDITPSVKAAEALERANATLERRVRERTGELTRLNSALERAKAEADDANVSKTALHRRRQPRHPAAAQCRAALCHQPDRAPARRRATRNSSRNVDASLEAVEEIFAALLDISRLDTGAMKPEMRRFPHRRIDAAARSRIRAAGARQGADAQIRAVLAGGALRPALAAAAAAEPGLERDQIYAEGRVLVGCRRRGSRLRIDVYDTGIGIPQAKRRAVFKEFHRLDQGARVARGVGPRTVDRRAHRARAWLAKSR